MTAYMPKVGKYGLDMMYRTCTVQTNLDFSSEADMVQEAARLARAAAGRDRDVRQFAVHRRQAERLSLVPLGDLARHRQRARRHAAVGVRAGHGLRALGRLRARRADVFRQARRQIYRRRRKIVPRSARRQARRAAGRARHHLRLGEPRLDDLPGGAAQALSRNARRRLRSVAAAAGLRRVLGRHPLRRRLARRRLGPGQGLDRARSARNCATTCRGSASRRRSATAACSVSPRRR